MCGLTGFFARRTLPSSTLEAMTSELVHRGPDDLGHCGLDVNGQLASWKTKRPHENNLRAGLGFRRLSILDLSENGAQPMLSDDRRFALCFNGQIYNYVEIKETKLKDVHWKGHSDTEVLLKMLEQEGIGSLKNLNGMFAIAWLDSVTKRLYLARDPVGIKPLYYTINDEGLFFASELRSLWKAPGVRKRLRSSLMLRYLMAGWTPDPDTLFEGVYRLEPGTFLTIDSSFNFQTHRYADLNFKPSNESDWTDKLNSVLDDTIQRQMRSDVPVGFFLSGGVDSSLLTARAAHLFNQKPSTFTIGFRWSHDSKDALDLQSARFMSEKFSLDHHEFIIEPKILSLLPTVVRCLEEPVMDPAALCSYLICEAASHSHKVLISGQGGDEVFGGYPVYQGGLMARALQKFPEMITRTINPLVQALPESFGKKPIHFTYQLKKLLMAVHEPWPESFFLLRSAMPGVPISSILASDLMASQEPPFSQHLSHRAAAESLDPLNQMLYYDMKTYLTATNLFYSDKTSMAHSVELRVPYLDWEMLSLATHLPIHQKIKGRERKHILKRLARRYLPTQITDRHKTGFGLPLRSWFRSELQPMALDLLSPDRLKKQSLFVPTTPHRWLSEHKALKADHAARLYLLIVFQLWLEELQVGI